MSQDEIVQLLEKTKRWMNTKQIQHALKNTINENTLKKNILKIKNNPRIQTKLQDRPKKTAIRLYKIKNPKKCQTTQQS